MTRELVMTYGVVCGLLIGLILVVILLKFANRDKKIKTEYDERQKEIRNKGYVYGFYTLVVLLAVESLWSMSGIGFPLPDYIMFFLTIIIGLMVMCCYSIWNGVYWGLNNNPKRYIIVMACALILNVIPVVRAISAGTLTGGDTSDSLPWLNIIVIVMMAVIGAELLIRHLVDKKAEED